MFKEGTVLNLANSIYFINRAFKIDPKRNISDGIEIPFLEKLVILERLLKFSKETPLHTILAGHRRN
jgi:hypothetical protein